MKWSSPESQHSQDNIDFYGFPELNTREGGLGGASTIVFLLCGCLYFINIWCIVVYHNLWGVVGGIKQEYLGVHDTPDGCH